MGSEQRESRIAPDGPTVLEALVAGAEILLREPFSAEAATRMLARLGEAAGVSRAFLMRHTPADAGDVVTDLMAEWLAEDAEPRTGSLRLQAVSYRESGNEWLLDRLEADQAVAARAEEFPSSWSAILECGDVHAILLAPIRTARGVWGAIGLDERRRPRDWTVEEIHGLRFAASLLAAAAERAGAENDRRSARARSRQSERMDALGWLAGGLARDFDGLMTTIRGYGDRVLDHLRPGDPLRDDVSEILLATERAAELTRDLASLGRRQPELPVRLDLAAWLAERLPLLRRLVGDEVELSASPAQSAVSIEADPDLLEQAVVTFVLEARERLAEGGRIELGCDRLEGHEIESRGVRDLFGDGAARLTVRDDARPLLDDTAVRPFEPFADEQRSTRDGLGLAAAYGIVRQCGGLVFVAASSSEGTTCELLFPLVREGSSAREPQAAAQPSTENQVPTVLVVEDEDLIRQLAEQILSELGYRVLSAANGGEALAVAEATESTIDLLLTDVVMPGVSGTDLAQRLLRRYPEMRVLYMSGYSDGLIFRYGVQQDRAAFLRKPFSAKVLERRVAELLAVGSAG